MAEPATHVASRRIGRRPGNPDTRQAVVTAARRVFAEKGYAGSTIRGIASAAEVDAALVHHYFGSKRDLFLATISVPVDPSVIVSQLAEGGLDGIGPRLVTTLLTAWDSPAQPALLAVLRAALDDPTNGRVMREFLTTEVIARLLSKLGFSGREAAQRGNAVASQMIGLIVGRYLLRIPGLADASASYLSALIGPTIQRYLTEELPS